MKKFKPLSEKQVAHCLHSHSKDYDNYLENLEAYKNELQKISDKTLASNFKKTAPKQKGVKFTLASVVDKGSGEGYIAISVCDPSDNFSRKMGRLIATDKATVHKDRNGVIKSGNPLVSFSIDEISSKTDLDIKREAYSNMHEINDLIQSNPKKYLPRNMEGFNFPLNLDEALEVFSK